MNATADARRGALRLVLLALALLVVLAHVVPFPFSAHTPFTSATESHGPSDSGPEASHVASCDATMSRLAPTVIAPEATVAWAAPSMSVARCALPRASWAVAVRSGRDHTGPPLFLLHASLLI